MLPETNQFRVTALALNVRMEPSASSIKIGSMPQGTVIEKIEENEAGTWVKFLFEGVEAWVSKKYLKKMQYVPPPGEDFLWMAIAEAEKGVHEIPGAANEPRVLEYLSATKNLSKYETSRDETPWCSAFVNWCVKQAGYEGTNHALARSWLAWGQEIEVPRRGCIVVFQREQKFGHVGFFLEETENEIKVLGGNQQNKETLLYEVSEKSYPKKDWLGYRIPA
jgi:uncharacterized protein (TIGR02594 family)